MSNENEAAKSIPKALIIIICILAAVIILLCSMFTGYFIMKGNSLTAADENPVMDSSYISLGDQMLSNGAIPNTYTDNVKQTEIKGVGTKTSVIERLRSNTDTSLQSLTRKADENAVYYSIGGDIVRIDIMAGTNGFQYNRSYYFNNGILYFSLIYQNGKQSCAYYFDDVMYRYITEDGQTMNNAFNDKKYMAIAKFTINEAYSFYNYKVKD